MTKHREQIAESRDLPRDEANLVRWLVEHGKPEAREFILELDELRVVSRCPCGCPSINFVLDGSGGMQILSDYVYEDTDGHTIGVFAFAQNGILAGIEVWSIAGDPIPKGVPDPCVLRPFAA
jgi:hypothetical protein